MDLARASVVAGRRSYARGEPPPIPYTRHLALRDRFLHERLSQSVEHGAATFAGIFGHAGNLGFTSGGTAAGAAKEWTGAQTISRPRRGSAPSAGAWKPRAGRIAKLFPQYAAPQALPTGPSTFLSGGNMPGVPRARIAGSKNQYRSPGARQLCAAPVAAACRRRPAPARSASLR